MKKAILAKNDTFWLPNAKQKKLAQLFADPTDNRTNQEKANEAGVSLRTYYRYIKDIRFIEYINNFVLPEETNKKIAAIWRSLCREAEKGNVQAIKLFFEAKGIYMPKNQMEFRSFSIYNQYNQLSDDELLQKKKELEQKLIELSKRENEQEPPEIDYKE